MTNLNAVAGSSTMNARPTRSLQRRCGGRLATEAGVAWKSWLLWGRPSSIGQNRELPTLSSPASPSSHGRGIWGEQGSRETPLLPFCLTVGERENSRREGTSQ